MSKRQKYTFQQKVKACEDYKSSKYSMGQAYQSGKTISALELSPSTLSCASSPSYFAILQSNMRILETIPTRSEVSTCADVVNRTPARLSSAMAENDFSKKHFKSLLFL